MAFLGLVGGRAPRLHDSMLRVSKKPPRHNLWIKTKGGWSGLRIPNPIMVPISSGLVLVCLRYALGSGSKAGLHLGLLWLQLGADAEPELGEPRLALT